MFLKSGNEKHTFGSKSFSNKKLTRDTTYERPGHLFTLKNRVVCESCNNGWMSEVEDLAKPILLKLISGTSCELSKNETSSISFWIAMKLVTAEFAEKAENLEVTPFSERKAMMEKRQIPNYFNIFIGSHSTGHNSAWLRSSWTMALSPLGPDPKLEGRERNSQSVSFIIGPIFIFVINIRLNSFDINANFNFGKLKKIHPSNRDFLKWPQKPLRKIQTDKIAFMCQDFIENPQVKYIKDLPK